MRCPKYDFHIHTKYLGCANATMEIPSIVRECKRLGVVSLAITDHLDSFDKLQLDRHICIREDIKKLERGVDVYFGVELDFIGYDQGFAFNQEIKENYGFQFAMGGIHRTYLEEYDLKKIIDIQHRHHLRTCRDPLVDVLVHPYWFDKGPFDHKGWQWFNSLKAVPEAYVHELGQVAKETGTAIEITPLNLYSYGEEYFDYLSILAEEGVMFSIGSDSHDIGRLTTIQDSWQIAERLELPLNQIWRPQCRSTIETAQTDTIGGC